MAMKGDWLRLFLAIYLWNYLFHLRHHIDLDV
jgi:hypothetical protein